MTSSVSGDVQPRELTADNPGHGVVGPRPTTGPPAVSDGPEPVHDRPRRPSLGAGLTGETLVGGSGDRLLRPDVAYEAIRLARTLAALQPDEPEVLGLLALCELTAARFPARTGPDGSPVLLEDLRGSRTWP